MGHSQAEKAQSRERILETAARQIREAGLDSVSIAELMKAANLTHGGFYGHFASRADLIAAAVERALHDGEAAFVAAKPSRAGTVKSIVNRYLSGAHRDDTGGGCAIGALAGDVARAEDEEVRARMGVFLERSFADMAKAMGDGPEAEEAALAAWCAMVGGIALARVFRGSDRSDQILRAARQSVLDLEDRVRQAE